MQMKIFPEEENEGNSVEFSSRRPNFLDLNVNTTSNRNGNEGENHVRPQLFELGRSMSAPPAEFLSSIQNLIDDSGEDASARIQGQGSSNSVTNDPSYAAYFYSNSRFDPRLPPPSFYSPGQSWQMWPSSISATGRGGSSLKPQRPSGEDAFQTLQQRKKLVDMIQEDFPRTPSPVHSLKEASGTGIHLLGADGGEASRVRRNSNRKPFSISGSVDAVMAAAIEAENDGVDLDFALEKLNLLPEEEEDEGTVGTSATIMSWNRSIRTSKAQPAEPFALAGNFADLMIPSIPAPITLNSAPARTANNNFNPHSFPPPQALQQPHYPPYATPFIPDETLKMNIMEDFRLNRGKRYELYDLKGMMIDFSTDQHGSRFIQQKLEVASDADKELVFQEIYPLALQLMTDVFGNYVIQKLFEYGSVEQRVALARVMHGNVLSLSLQMYGCRVVQKALEHVPSDEQIRLVQELEGHVLRCVKDQNGNHVIQKCIECVPLETSAPFLTASFMSQASTLAMHPYGCRVIQRIFEHGPKEHSQALLDELLKSTGTLIQDQYGNYVIQHVLEHGDPSDRSRIIKYIQGRLLEYSRHKFASNVVEKCVSFGTDAERQELIEEILKPIPAANAEEASSASVEGGMVIPLHLMMKDQFANYVVQKMLEIVDGEQRNLLLSCIKPHLSQLRKYTYGKHILAKVEKMLGIAPASGTEAIVYSSREYHSAPNSPVTRNSSNFEGHSNLNPNANYNGSHGGGYNNYNNAPYSAASYRPPRPHPKISKNDYNEFPPLSSSFSRNRK